MRRAAAAAKEAWDPKQVQVVYAAPSSPDGQEIPKSSSSAQCGDEQGWHYDDEATPTKIELCPAACELVRAGGEMSIAFGCEPKILI